MLFDIGLHVYNSASQYITVDESKLQTLENDKMLNLFKQNVELIDQLFGEFDFEGETNNHYRELLEKNLKCNKEFVPLLKIYSLCGECSITAKVVELSLVCLWVPKLEKFIKGFYSQSVTMEFCMSIWSGEEKTLNLLKQYDTAKNFLIVTSRNLPYYRQSFIADDVLSDFVVGEPALDYTIKTLAFVEDGARPLQQLYINRHILDEICQSLKNNKVVHISGEIGCGRRLLVRHACRETEIPLLMVNIQQLFKQDNNISDRMNRIKRMAMLFDYALCFWSVDSSEEGFVLQLVEEVLSKTEQLKTQVIIITDTDVAIIPHYHHPVDHIAVPQPCREERTALWQGYGKQYGYTEIDWVLTSNKYSMSANEIHKVMQQLSILKHTDVIDEKSIMRACHRVLPPAQGDFHKANVKFNIDDLKIPEDSKSTLHNICAHVLYRHKVYNEWGMEGKFPYGTSVSAMFVGASGTGKTMAVHVLSNMLNIPIYQVDLSQVVDKYIGETEKKLEEIFDRAQKSNTILFFDEADSVFGKRSDVTEAKDKYANTQVSYILQRIEQYDGIVILATNYRRNIDDAVLRRMRYILEFQLPNMETRLSLWQSTFAEETPIENIDFEYLASQFELSGGAIKNIALNATFLAAAENVPVMLKHLLLCILDENRKLGKSMLKQDFGRYGYLIF